MSDSKTDSIKRAAEISACGQYRYELRRSWDKSKSACVFVMLGREVI